MMVLQEGCTYLHSQHLKLPTLPNSSLTTTSSDSKKSKNFHGSKVSVAVKRNVATIIYFFFFYYNLLIIVMYAYLGHGKVSDYMSCVQSKCVSSSGNLFVPL